MIAAFLATALFFSASSAGFVDAPFFRKEAIFAPERKHNHASCVVELPDGDLFAAWYSGSGEREADDVAILAARKRKGADAWSERFILSDTPGYPDLNPSLLVGPDRSFWLVYPTVLDHRWEGALLKYFVADAVAIPIEPKPPAWKRQGVFHVTPTDFDKAFEKALAEIKPKPTVIDETAVTELSKRARDPLYQRLGWMPRAHPTVLPSGRWLWPLYTDTFSASIVAYSDDRGDVWKFGAPLFGFGNIQPSLVRKKDGTVVAFMRDNGRRRRIRRSESKDEGATWSEVSSTALPNPGAGIEAIRLIDGRWLLVYNDLTRGRHSLVVSLSQDEGETWKVSRHVEAHRLGEGLYHYPSVVQTRDGLIHLTYTRGGLPQGSNIEHAWFNTAWIDRGDDEASAIESGRGTR